MPTHDHSYISLDTPLTEFLHYFDIGLKFYDRKNINMREIWMGSTISSVPLKYGERRKLEEMDRKCVRDNWLSGSPHFLMVVDRLVHTIFLLHAAD